MAFRHYQGTPPPVHVAWKCPTCSQEVTTPLEQGCPHCKAGADAKAAAQRVVEGIQQRREVALRTPVVQVSETPEDAAFAEWYNHSPDDLDQLQYARLAFAAGAAWAKGNPHSEVAEVPQGGWYLIIAPRDVSKDVIEGDDRVTATILAALDFYIGNQLNYGPVPGQLSAAECRELIAKLQPQEQEASE